MASALKAVLFNRVGESSAAFRRAFDALGTINVVEESQDWDSLRAAVDQGGIDLVAISLDGAEQECLEIIRRLTHLYSGCGILGVSSNHSPAGIIAAMRAGCSQFVCSPIEQEDLRQAIDRMHLRQTHSNNDSKRICVIGSAGGAGATTIACNLALELGQITERRCAIVDLNLEFGDVAATFDCSPNFSIADVCQQGVDIDGILLGRALQELPCNVSLLARPERIESAREVTSEGLGCMFNIMKMMFPYVVVDLPRMSDYLTGAAVDQADRVLIITQLTVQYLRNATRLYKCLLGLGVEESRVDLVVNRVNSGGERISQSDVEQHFGRPVLATIPNDYQQVQASLDLGQPMLKEAPNTPARLAIHDLARSLTGEAPKKQHRGLLNLLRWSR